ncbi:MAG: pre-peptidase C-terminal domain-containing protein, partial [Dehalococcoidia bacterium]
TVDAVLGAPDDADYFEFDGTAGQRVVITADGALGVDTFAQIFGPAGAFLRADDDSGHGLDAELDLVLPATGRYRVEVTPVRSKLGPYRFSLQPGADPQDASGQTRDAVHAVALTYLDALQRGDAPTLLGLAGPEALALWGWESAADVQRDLAKLQSIGVEGAAAEPATRIDAAHARTTIALVGSDAADLGSLRFDLTNEDGRWRVDFVQRVFVPPPSLLATPLPLAWALPPISLDGAKPPPRVSALAAVVVDEASGSILFDKDAHRPLPPASLTKIATAILAVEDGDLDASVDVDVDSRKMRGSTLMGLRPDDEFPLRDLLYGLMLPSGNDAALAIARHLAGSDGAFVARMNGLLGRIGLAGSRFTDPHGLGSPDHRASAYDLAMLSRYAMTLPDFAAVVAARSWTADGSRRLSLTNTNRLLATYRGADGLKSGFTKEAGRTLAASATRNGRRLYVVLLDAPTRYTDARALLDWAFTSFCWPATDDAPPANASAPMRCAE